MGTWVKVAATTDLPEGESLSVECESERIALFNVGGDYFAVNGQCPHAAGPLWQGFVENGRVVCPWHSWSFALAYDDAADDRLCRYRTRVQGDAIEIELPGSLTPPSNSGGRG